MAVGKDWKYYEQQKQKQAAAEKQKSYETASNVPVVKQVDMADGHVLIGHIGTKPVYIEPHQGKHRVKKWPTYTKKSEGPFFLEKFVSPSNSPLFVALIQSDLFSKRKQDVKGSHPAKGMGILYFDFGKTVVGTEKETSCQLQWTEKPDYIAIHGCPDEKGAQFGVSLDISALA